MESGKAFKVDSNKRAFRFSLIFLVFGEQIKKCFQFVQNKRVRSQGRVAASGDFQ